MLEQFFINIVEISIQASILILAIVLLRFCFKKIPKQFLCLFWMLAAIRLIFPFEIKSPFSLVPDTGAVKEVLKTTYDTVENISNNIQPVPNMHANSDANINNTTYSEQTTESILQAEPFYPSADTSTASDSSLNIDVNYNTEMPETNISAYSLLDILAIIWLATAIAFMLYGVISYLRIKHSLKDTVHDKDNIWYSDRIPSPFVLGYLKPRIYIPYNIDSTQLPYIIAHEKAHISRLDHIGKFIGYLLLCFYWFNPVIWFAYLLYCRDLELACDERVLEQLGTEQKKSYSTALLDCSVNNKTILQNPLAFSEVAIKERIKHILNYKKPGLWIITLVIIIAVIYGICFMTTAVNKNSSDVSESISSELADTYNFFEIKEKYAEQIESFPGRVSVLEDGTFISTTSLQDHECAIATKSDTNEQVYHWMNNNGANRSFVKTYPLEVVDGVLRDVPAKVVTEDELLQYAFGKSLLQTVYAIHPYGIKQYILRDNGILHVNIGYEDDRKSFLTLEYLTFELSEDMHSATLTKNGIGYYLLGLNNPESLDAFRKDFTGKGHFLPEDTSELPWKWLVELNGETVQDTTIYVDDVPNIPHMQAFYDYTGMNIFSLTSYDRATGFTISEIWKDGEAFAELRYLTSEDDLIIIFDSSDDVVSVTYNGEAKNIPDNFIELPYDYYASSRPAMTDVDGDGQKEFVDIWWARGTGYLPEGCEVYRLDTPDLEKIPFDIDISEFTKAVKFNIIENSDYDEDSGLITFTLQYEDQMGESTAVFDYERLPVPYTSDMSLEDLTKYVGFIPYENTVNIYMEDNSFEMGVMLQIDATAINVYLGKLTAKYMYDTNSNRFIIDKNTVTLEVY